MRSQVRAPRHLLPRLGTPGVRETSTLTSSTQSGFPPFPRRSMQQRVLSLRASGFVDGIRMAALSQFAVDLLTGPGRNPSEATALLDWMADHQAQWRR